MASSPQHAPDRNPRKDRISLKRRLRILWRRLTLFWREIIWKSDSIENDSSYGKWMRCTRILFITWDGLNHNRLFARAAALSYSSLLALGPMVAMIVLLSGSFFRGNAETQIKNILHFVAPTLQEYITLEQNVLKENPDSPVATADFTADEEGRESGPAEYASALDELITQIVTGAENLIEQINTSGSGAFGLIGLLILIFIAIQMLTAVETTLNHIWGARSGRTWGHRIVSYWTFISLGAVLGLGGAAIFSASAVANLFAVFPFGAALNELFILASPILGFGMITVLLTVFYMYFPNAPVQWKPALIGAVVVGALLFLNNYLSVLYVGQVLRLQSLYGSVGIVPVLMLGLYFFWVFILLGGQLSYAIQNVNFLSRREAWSKVSPRARETLTLAAFLLIARQFAAQRPPLSAPELSARMRVPGSNLNASLNLLVDIDWIVATPQAREDGSEETCYQPAKPLGQVTLADFHSAFGGSGSSPGEDTLETIDPLIAHYRESVETGLEKELGDATLEELLSAGESGSGRGD